MTNKTSVFFGRLAGGSVKKMLMHIGLIHKETGKNRVWLFFDMTRCILRFKMGYSDYHCFGFANVRGKRRLTFLTMNDNITLSRKLNSREDFDIFYDKGKFNKAFAEFAGREWLDLRAASREDFGSFCEGKDSFFAKPVDGCGGTDVERIALSEGSDLDALYDRLIRNGQLMVEQEIVQHEKMSSLAGSSVNTLRIVTLCHKGELYLMYAMLRMSDGKKCVDNICGGGMYCPIDTDGVIRKPAYCSATGEFYEPHPLTGTSFIDFEIPYYKEAVELVKKASEKFPNMGYLGWDVAVTPEGPILLEANNMPGFDIAQNYGHLDEKIGIKPRFEAILGKDFFND